jgi:hypothetical protein
MERCLGRTIRLGEDMDARTRLQEAMAHKTALRLLEQINMETQYNHSHLPIFIQSCCLNSVSDLSCYHVTYRRRLFLFTELWATKLFIHGSIRDIVTLFIRQPVTL